MATRDRQVHDWPRAFRTLGDSRFRMILATVLWAVGALVLTLVLIRQAGLPLAQGQYGFDFLAYQRSSQLLLATGSPYDPSMLAGPVPAQGALLLKYPPILAQLLVPFANLPLDTANTIWLVIQAACAYAGVWLAGSAGGLRPSRERLLWTGVACTWFLPVFDTLWVGNISGVLAGLVGLAAYAGLRGGAALAGLGLLKGIAGLAAPVALVRDRRTAVGAVGTAALGIGLSALFAPAAWVDYLRILPNLIAGSPAFASNFAPDQALGRLAPGNPMLGQTARVVAVIVGIGALALGCLQARRPDGWVAAVTLGVVASLLIPSALWYHFFVLLLPLGALAWGRLGPSARASLVGAGALLTVGLAAPILTVVGASIFVGLVVASTWSR
ncbi:MAG: glycosyltransferase family 87 protein [Candidatus Limnocylindrales bacterium]